MASARQHSGDAPWAYLTTHRVGVMIVIVACAASLLHASYHRDTVGMTIKNIQSAAKTVQKNYENIKSMLQGTSLVHQDKNKASTANSVAPTETLPARVVIIGGGLAGCVAAIEAASCGAQVILLEKEAKIGGNSAKATSGINGWGTRAQAQQGIVDAGKYFERDTYRSGVGGNCDPGLVRMLSVKSADAIKFLTDFGIPLTVLSQLGGASRKRCHRAPDKSDGTPVPIGFFVLRTLERFIRENMSDKITVLLNAQVTRLMTDKKIHNDGSEVTYVTGVEYVVHTKQKQNTSTPAHAAAAVSSASTPITPEQFAPVTIPTRSVILATGGFSNDHTSRSLLQEFAPQLSSFPTTNGEWATGDGVKMARELGVELVDMDKVQLHPTGLIDPKNPSGRTKFLGPEALRGSGGVLLNKSGERFVNELDLRSVVSQAIIAQNNEYPGSGGSKFAYCVLNEAAVKLFGKNALGFYWKQLGLFVRVENVEELAKLIGCNVDVLKRTLTQYEQISSGKVQACHVTGKNVFPCVIGPQGPFFVAYVTPSIHYTMGGCLITPSAEMQTADTTNIVSQHRPVLGLFGAGEVTGGLHGMNRLGGNSLLECVVFGRIAGDRAGNSVLSERDVVFDRTDSVNDGAAAVMSVRVVRQVGSPEDVDEVSARDVVLNLPSVFHRSGLALLEPVRLRSVSDCTLPTVVLTPASLPGDYGMMSFHLPPRTDRTKAKWLYTLEPGQRVEASLVDSAHTPYNAATIEGELLRLRQRCARIVVVAGEERGVSATVQLLRMLVQVARVLESSVHPQGRMADTARPASVSLVYLMEVSHSTYARQLFAQMSERARNELSVQFVDWLSDGERDECKGSLSHHEETALRAALTSAKASAEGVGVIVVGADENMQRVLSFIQTSNIISSKEAIMHLSPHSEGL